LDGRLSAECRTLTSNGVVPAEASAPSLASEAVWEAKTGLHDKLAATLHEKSAHLVLNVF
jgi:hypothetical protein